MQSISLRLVQNTKTTNKQEKKRHIWVTRTYEVCSQSDTEKEPQNLDEEYIGSSYTEVSVILFGEKEK